MKEIIWEAVPTLLGALLAAGMGILSFIWQRKMAAIDEFKIFISIKDGEIDVAKNATAFYNDTKVEIRNAVFKLFPFLGSRKRERLKRLLMEYSKITQDDLIGLPGHIKSSLGIPVKTTVENSLEHLHKFMDGFLKSV